eukprot:5793747-Pleurochrysis_carterae.AAC.1
MGQWKTSVEQRTWMDEMIWTYMIVNGSAWTTNVPCRAVNERRGRQKEQVKVAACVRIHACWLG